MCAGAPVQHGPQALRGGREGAHRGGRGRRADAARERESGRVARARRLRLQSAEEAAPRAAAGESRARRVPAGARGGGPGAGAGVRRRVGRDGERRGGGAGAVPPARLGPARHSRRTPGEVPLQGRQPRASFVCLFVCLFTIVSFSQNSRDNMTAVIVTFSGAPKFSQTAADKVSYSVACELAYLCAIWLLG